LQVLPQEKSGNWLMRITLQLSERQTLYTRTYSNILNIFGNITGLFKVLSMILTFLLSPLQYLLMKLTFLFYTFDVKCYLNNNSKVFCDYFYYD